MAKKAPPGFNTPFRDLKPSPPPRATVPASAVPSSSKSSASPSSLPPPSKKPAAAPTPAAGPARSSATEDEQLFEQAMRGVTPLAAAERTRRASPLGASPVAGPSRATLRARARRDDALADAELVELVAKPGRLTIEELGETVTGLGEGVDRRLLRRLAAGEYAVDAELELHGLTRVASEAALERALRRARADGQRCLLVIHGRGLNSGEEGPVLKRAVIEALGGGTLGRLVLAFTSAPPPLGGPGATLVLLRKPSA